MSEEHCPLCNIRVSNWAISSGKTAVIDGKHVHKSCLMDFKLQSGRDYKGG